MSYAIIRNEKYKRGNLKGIYRHNERRNTNYSNKNIDKEKSYLNYSLKEPIGTYEKEFDRIREEYNLKGQIKEVSNIACEYIITSDNKFFSEIEQAEARRYFETAYKFVCEYKDLGEQYILSAKVHMDEETPHMHLVFIPVVHTTDKLGNSIDKIACSEFWKADIGNYWKSKDAYINLQDSFYKYVVDNGFALERGQQVGNKHIPIEQLKKITNFEKSKIALKDIEIKLPDVPDIKEFNKIMFGRDEKIQKEIIVPKDKLIKQLHSDNVRLYRELDKQVHIIDKASKYEKDYNSIIANNKELQEKCNTMESEFYKKVEDLENSYVSKNTQLEEKFNNKFSNLEKEFEAKTIEIKKEARRDCYDLERENQKLHRIVDTVKDTIGKFIKWVCRKFDMSAESVMRDFEKENNVYLDPEKQIEKIDKEKEWDLEM